jgi:deferrochelatase/peroxidase EfeB
MNTPPNYIILAKTNKNPDWMAEGSFLVFRKLDQDVQAFQKLIEDHRPEEVCTDKLQFGAKLMGRWPTGKFLVLSPV